MSAETIFPDLIVRVDLDTDPMTDERIWTETPPGVINGDITRGWNVERGEPQAGEMTLRIYDPDWVYDQTNTSSPIYGGWDLGRPFQLAATVGGVERNQFTGIVDRIVRPDAGMQMDEVEIHLFDPFFRLNQLKLSITLGPMLSGAMVVAVLDAAGIPGTGLYSSVGNRSIDAGSSMIDKSRWKERSVLEILGAIAKADGGILYVSRSGAITFVERLKWLTQEPYITPNAVFSDDPDEGFGYQTAQIETNGSRVATTVTGQRAGGKLYKTPQNTEAARRYGPSTKELGIILAGDERELEDRCWHERGKLSKSQIELPPIKIDATGAGNDLWAVVLGHELGWRERFIKHRKNGSAIVQDGHFANMRQVFECRDSRSWEAFYQLANALPYKPWFLSQNTLHVDTTWIF